MPDAAAPEQTELTDVVVTRVGKAVADIVRVRQAYEARVTAAQTDDEKNGLSLQAETEAVQAIQDQGLSVEQYNHVIAATEDDPELENRVLAAAQSG